MKSLNTKLSKNIVPQPQISNAESFIGGAMADMFQTTD